MPVVGTFVGIDGTVLPYCDHPYNAARTNERAVEVPIALRWVESQPGPRGLEVGNVLQHYAPERAWDCVDRWENAPGVINVDIMDFAGGPYDWIVSLSTIEHIGWDDLPRDGTKAFLAINHMRSLLAPGGALLLSFPLGHHRGLDGAVAGRGLGESTSWLYARTDEPTERSPGAWEQRSMRLVPYLDYAWSAGAVWFGIFGGLP